MKFGKKKKNRKNQHFHNARSVDNIKESLRIIKNGVIIRGTEESDSTDFGDDEDEGNEKFRNGLMKNPSFYHKKILINNKYIDYIVARVNNTDIYHSSFNSLTGNQWIENFLVDTYLKKKYENIEKVQIEPFSIGTILFLGNLSKREIEEMSKNIEIRKKIIIFPIFEQNHFYCVIVDCNKETIIICDSNIIKKNEKKYYNQKFNIFLNTFKMFSEIYNAIHDNMDLKLPKMKHLIYDTCNKQSDNNNCGIYMFINIAQYVETESISINNKIDLVNIRKDIQTEIIKFSSPMHDSCLICGKNVNITGESIRCSKCHRYIHIDELNMIPKNIKISEKFYCPLCK